jgi:hypothetical protein
VFLISSSTFERIAWCESRNKPWAKNPNSTASGRYQFIESSWEGYAQELWGDQWVLHDKWDYTDSTILAAYVFGRNGTSDWLASSPCWLSTEADS